MLRSLLLFELGNQIHGASSNADQAPLLESAVILTQRAEAPGAAPIAHLTHLTSVARVFAQMSRQSARVHGHLPAIE